MRKSDIKVSMPMSTFEEINIYKDKYVELISKIGNLFDTSVYDAGENMIIHFDAKEAMNFCKKYLHEKYKKIPIDIIY